MTNRHLLPTDTNIIQQHYANSEISQDPDSADSSNKLLRNTAQLLDSVVENIESSDPEQSLVMSHNVIAPSIQSERTTSPAADSHQAIVTDVKHSLFFDSKSTNRDVLDAEFGLLNTSTKDSNNGTTFETNSAVTSTTEDSTDQTTTNDTSDTSWNHSNGNEGYHAAQQSLYQYQGENSETWNYATQNDEGFHVQQGETWNHLVENTYQDQTSWNENWNSTAQQENLNNNHQDDSWGQIGQDNPSNASGDTYDADETETHCQTCWTDTIDTERVFLNCGHVQCLECLNNNFRHGYSAKRYFPPHCCDIEQGIELASVQGFLEGNVLALVLERHEEFTSANATWCSNVKCRSFIPDKEHSEQWATCPNRQSTTCLQCKACQLLHTTPDSHPKLLCGKDQDLAEKEGWKQCPSLKCQKLIEKNDGCNHMTCDCGTEFCYLCGSEMTDGTPCNCQGQNEWIENLNDWANGGEQDANDDATTDEAVTENFNGRANHDWPPVTEQGEDTRFNNESTEMAHENNGEGVAEDSSWNRW